MHRTLTAIRRTIRAAVNAATALATAVRGRRFALLVDLCRAVDTGAQVVIGYRKTDGSESVRTIRPLDLRATSAGDITVRAADHQSGEDRTFRVDRITSHQTISTAVALAA